MDLLFVERTILFTLPDVNKSWNCCQMGSAFKMSAEFRNIS